FRDPETLMSVSLTSPAAGDNPRHDDVVWSYPKFAMFRDAQTSFDALALYARGEFNLTDGDAERLRGEWVGASYLITLGVGPILGAGFSSGLDAHPDARREAIISYSLWQRRFNADPRVIGRTIDVDRQPYEIVAVTRAGF